MRNLGGVYFRVRRNGKWESVCFADLTMEEREAVCAGRSAEWFKSLAYHLADIIQHIVEELDLVMEDE